MRIEIIENENLEPRFLIEVNDTELLWLRDDVADVSSEYYISKAYQDFAKEFINAATEAENKL